MKAACFETRSNNQSESESESESESTEFERCDHIILNLFYILVLSLDN